MTPRFPPTPRQIPAYKKRFISTTASPGSSAQGTATAWMLVPCKQSFCFRIPNPRDTLLTPHLPEALHITLTYRQLAYPASSDSKSMNDAFFSVHQGSHFSTDLKTYEHLSIKNLALAEAPGTRAILHSYPRREGRLVHGLPQPRSYELHSRVEARALLQTQWESCGEKKKQHQNIIFPRKLQKRLE